MSGWEFEELQRSNSPISSRCIQSLFTPTGWEREELRQRSNSPINISSCCLHLHPVMGQSQQKMKLFELEPTIHSPTPTKQPLFIDSSNINDENKPSAFQNFIDSRRTKS